METYARSIEAVGTVYRNNEVEAFMDHPTDITLVLEPHNKYDPFAIMVMSGNKHLGFVPAHLAARIHKDGLQNKIVGKYYESFWTIGKNNRARIIFDILLTD